MASQGNDRSAKDKQMAARLKDQGVERETGRCAICYSLIRNVATYGHYCQHARGFGEKKEE